VLELVVSETLVECFVDLEPEVKEREHAVGLLALAACLRVGMACGASRGFETRPALRSRQEALPEVAACVVVDHVRSPPAETSVVAARRFSSPRDDELERQNVVELLG
jgi:hypothetical protein